MKLESIPKFWMRTRIYISHSLRPGYLLNLDKLKDKTIIIAKRIKDTKQLFGLEISLISAR